MIQTTTSALVELDDADVTREDLEHIVAHIGSFGEDNRAGIERTLHRSSAIRNRAGAVVGLTCRIGRAVFGTIAIIEDLVESGESILILGHTCSGAASGAARLAVSGSGGGKWRRSQNGLARTGCADH